MVLNFIFPEKKPADVKHPFLIVHLHVTLKGIQCGLFSGPFAASAYCIYKKNFADFWRYTIKCQLYGIIGIVLISNIATIYMLNQATQEFNQSRAYRIQKNQLQCIADQFTLGGMLVGPILFKKLGTFKNLQSIKYSGIYLGGMAGIYCTFAIATLQYAQKSFF